MVGDINPSSSHFLKSTMISWHSGSEGASGSGHSRGKFKISANSAVWHEEGPIHWAPGPCSWQPNSNFVTHCKSVLHWPIRWFHYFQDPDSQCSLLGSTSNWVQEDTMPGIIPPGEMSTATTSPSGLHWLLKVQWTQKRPWAIEGAQGAPTWDNSPRWGSLQPHSSRSPLTDILSSSEASPELHQWGGGTVLNSWAWRSMQGCLVGYGKLELETSQLTLAGCPSIQEKPRPMTTGTSKEWMLSGSLGL